MPAEKQLQTVREKIAKALPLLENFLQENYNPTSEETQLLKKSLEELTDELTVYLHYISKKEISSSFDLHAAVSKLASNESDFKTAQKERAQTTHEKVLKPENEKEQIIPMEATSHSVPASVDPKPIPLSINDRYLVLKNLFKNEQSEWNAAWQQFSVCSTREEIIQYLNSLAEHYGWNLKDPAYQSLERACLKKFS
ncbi:MAG: hypothetical protein N3F09_04715 [Bacteroidia bacterium]|nr:hypothetical protein [Bacteroidia bacterium]